MALALLVSRARAPQSPPLSGTPTSPARLADDLRGHWPSKRCITSPTSPSPKMAPRSAPGAGPSVMTCLRNLLIGVLCRTEPVNLAAALRHHARDPARPLATLGITPRSRPLGVLQAARRHGTSRQVTALDASLTSSPHTPPQRGQGHSPPSYTPAGEACRFTSSRRRPSGEAEVDPSATARSGATAPGCATVVRPGGAARTGQHVARDGLPHPVSADRRGGNDERGSPPDRLQAQAPRRPDRGRLRAHARRSGRHPPALASLKTLW